MRLSIKSIFVFAMLLFAAKSASAVDVVTPKLEMRSAWVATVWGIDWPKGSTIDAQKKEMVKMLDSLQVNNFNAVNFQVRGMSDAMYKSSYEPWASWLTGVRGKDPGWDPLAYFVEECHKRGLECHAWVNPYRFNSSSTSGGTAGDGTGYVEKGWVMNAGSGQILNPGLAEVQDQIVKICKEIISNYDVDGMLFDDYYYNGAAMSADASTYAAYTSAGGKLSQANWRRKNVTDLMRKLYKMIEETKPWVRFGQAPQGTTYTDQSLADKYGLERCPANYDNNYGSQYIDIMEWLDNGLIDFISPQVYWTLGNSTADYSKIVPWWGKVVKRFNRHLFVSHSISSLTTAADVTAPELQSLAAICPTEEAGGPNNNKFSEYANEIMLNRSSSLNGSCGSIYYSVKYIYNNGNTPSFGHYLKRYLYSRPALMPAMTWKTMATDPGKVQNFKYDEESILTWDALPNMRYSVYAVPNGMSIESFGKEVDYLMGMTYGTTFTVPEQYRSGYYFAVCPYDRYANEWAPTVWKPDYTETLAAPVLISPEDGFSTDSDFTFTWNEVAGAERYVVDFATDAEFTHIQKTAQVTTNSLPISEVYNYIDKNAKIYWRVHSSAKGKNDGVSESRWFRYVLVQLTAPADGATSVDPKVLFTWTAASDGVIGKLEVATDEAFENVVLTRRSKTGSYQTKILELHPQTLYYARVSVNGRASKYVTFRTKAMPCSKPTFKNPINGGICYSDGRIEINEQDGAELVTIQVDITDQFGSSKAQKQLSDYENGVAASEIKISRKNPMEDGTTYYARAMAKYYDENGVLQETDWSDVISFVYSSSSSTGIGEVNGTEALACVENGVLMVKSGKGGVISVKAVNMLGASAELYEGEGGDAAISLANLAEGAYVIQVKVGEETIKLKYVKQ